jgi:hypothetical protein
MEISKFGMAVFFYPECKMPLGKIGDHNNNYSGNSLADQHFPLKDFYQQFKQAVVYEKIKGKGQKITKKLDSPP